MHLFRHPAQKSKAWRCQKELLVVHVGWLPHPIRASLANVPTNDRLLRLLGKRTDSLLQFDVNRIPPSLVCTVPASTGRTYEIWSKLTLRVTLPDIDPKQIWHRESSSALATYPSKGEFADVACWRMQMTTMTQIHAERLGTVWRLLVLISVASSWMLWRFQSRVLCVFVWTGFSTNVYAWNGKFDLRFPVRSPYLAPWTLRFRLFDYKHTTHFNTMSLKRINKGKCFFGRPSSCCFAGLLFYLGLTFFVLVFFSSDIRTCRLG